MGALLTRIRLTSNNRIAGTIRIVLGFLLLSAGVMKLAVPTLRTAFSGQLAEAALPFHTLSMWFVPITEVVIGGLLIVGFLSRVASLVAIPMMLVATYVHLVVHNPELFPMQPEAPIVPLVTIALCVYILWAGSGARSMDLRHQG